SYRPLYGAFLDERRALIMALPDARRALALLEATPGAVEYARLHVGDEVDDREALRAAVMWPLAVQIAEREDGFECPEEAFDAIFAPLDRGVAGSRHLYDALAPLVGVLVSEPPVDLGRGVSVVRADVGDIAAGWPEASLLVPPGFGGEPDRRCALAVTLELDPGERPPRLASLVEDAVRALRLVSGAAIATGPVGFERIDGGPRPPVALTSAASHHIPGARWSSRSPCAPTPCETYSVSRCTRSARSRSRPCARVPSSAATPASGSACATSWPETSSTTRRWPPRPVISYWPSCSTSRSATPLRRPPTRCCWARARARTSCLRASPTCRASVAGESVGDGRGALLGHHGVLVEALECERLDQRRRLAGRDQLGHRHAADGRGLEAPGAPAGVNQEAFDLGQAHDRAVVGRHVAVARPLAQDLEACQERHQLERVVRSVLQERERRARVVGRVRLDLRADQELAAVGLRDVHV